MCAQLSPLERDGLVEVWNDQQLRATESREWEGILLGKLRSARVIVILYSADFASSEYCTKELELALSRKQNKEAIVVIVYLRPTALPETVTKYQLLPNKKSPVSSFPDPDGPLMKIALEISKELKTKPLPASAQVLVSDRWVWFFNRTEQVARLKEMLTERKSRSKRPLVFLLAGPQDEKHDLFHERLMHEFPLEKPFHTAVNCENPGRLRFNGDAPSDPAVRSAYVKELIERSLGFDSATRSLPNGLTYVRAKATVGRGSLSPAATIIWLKTTLDFLNRFATLSDDQAVCFGISIEWAGRNLGEKVLRREFPEDRYDGLAFRVLPDLESPRRTDADAWVDTVARLKPGGLTLTAGDRLLQSVQDLFGSARTLPMGALYTGFEKLLA